MNILTHWANLYSHRTDWAYEAHRKFLHSFENQRIRETWEIRKNSEVFVAVFGPSQVGKTTLILKLIGISPKFLSFVSHCLRGGREPGKSSTATATVYARSPDNAFYIRDFTTDGMIKCESDALFIQRVANIRARVERQQAFETNPVEVWIPAHYFVQLQESEDASISIVDLPGFNSSTVEEHAHVNSLIQRYIPSASLIILIDEVFHMSRFKHFGIDLLDSWKYYPERFRIVLTKSVSANSIRQLVTQDVKPEAFQMHVRDQFRSTVDELPDSMKVYPLEYGDTWNTLLRADPSVSSELVNLMDELVDELRKDILGSLDEYSLIRANMKLYHAVRKMYQNEARSLKITSHRIKTQLTRTGVRLGRLESLLSVVEDRIQILGDALSQMNSDWGPSMTPLKPISKLVDPDRSAAKLKEFIRCAVSQTHKEANEKLSKYEEELQSYINDSLSSTLNFVFESRLPRLTETDLTRLANTDEMIIPLSNRTDYYLPIISWLNGHWEHDLRVTNDIAVRVMEVANAQINRMINVERTMYKHTLETTQKRFVYLKERLEWRIAKTRERIFLLQQERIEHHSRIYEFRQKKLADLANARKLQFYLSRAFRESWAAIETQVNHNSMPPSDKLLYLAYLKTLVKEYEKLLGA